MLSRASAGLTLGGCIVGVALGSVERAEAAGVEDTVTGTTAIGRSAGYVRANDVLAVWQNPANLALVPGRDLAAELRIGMFHGCFDRTPDPAIEAANGYLATESFDEVCNDGGPQFAGTLGFAMPLPRGFGFGVGVFTPGGQRKTKYGSDAINTLRPATNETLPITSGVRETASRYLLLERDVLAAFLMVGAGYQPNRWVRFGLSVGAGAVDIKYKNVTSVFAGVLNDQEVVADVQVLDSFVPRITASAVVSPLDALDLMATFTWTDDISADGTVDMTANGFDAAPRNRCSDAAPGPHCRVDDVTLRVPFQRFEVVLGARYAARRVPKERALDPMRDEIWDVEVDAFWSQTGHIDSFDLAIWDAKKGPQRVAFGSAPDAPAQPLPQEASIPHRWQDTYGVRAGGDYNVLAERLAVRAGLAYESRAVQPKNLTLDYWPLERVTISLGATVAISRWKLSVAYAHIFQESADVKLGQGNVREIAALSLEGRSAQVVNEGKYDSSVDVVSLQANVTF